METVRKHSRKRDAILQCLRETDVHPSAEWVYQKLKPQIPDLSLGTVYRNLSLFKAGGQIASLGTVQGLERFDGNTEPHAHFICRRCGRVLDLAGVELPESVLRQAGDLSGHRAESCRLTFSGCCRFCEETEKIF